MKWPETLTLVRHDESSYNALRAIKEVDNDYLDFKTAFENNPEADRTIALAKIVKEKLALKIGDHNTPLAEGAGHQAEIMASKLKTMIDLPNVIFTSPYDRTLDTLSRMMVGWPQLAEVVTYQDGRLREQEHGLSIIYNDWRVFHTLEPQQREFFALQGPYWYKYPQGENVESVRERLRSFNTTLTREYAEKRVLVITHHLLILAYRANQERWSAGDFLNIDENEKPINAGVTIYRGNPTLGEDGRLVLDSYNSKLY